MIRPIIIPWTKDFRIPILRVSFSALSYLEQKSGFDSIQRIKTLRSRSKHNDSRLTRTCSCNIGSKKHTEYSSIFVFAVEFNFLTFGKNVTCTCISPSNILCYQQYRSISIMHIFLLYVWLIDVLNINLICSWRCPLNEMTVRIQDKTSSATLPAPAYDSCSFFV